jgi:hypothetical protein
MYYCYETLQKYYDANKSLGSWNGREVYACPRKELYKKPFDYYYIVYDDERMGKFPLVRANRLYGLVTASGGVEECHPMEEYLYPTPTPTRQTLPEEETVDYPNEVKDDSPTMDNPVVDDTNLSSLVDEMLKKARNITIEDLVGDFCYE